MVEGGILATHSWQRYESSQGFTYLVPFSDLIQGVLVLSCIAELSLVS
jgi:hypothetical protein